MRVPARLPDVRRPGRQHGPAREDGRAADPGFDRRRRAGAPGVGVSSFADRLRGVLRPGSGIRDSGFEGSRVCDAGDAAEILGGEWRETRGNRYLVIDTTYSPGYRHGRVSVADALRSCEGWPSLSLLGGRGSNFLFLDLETTGLAGGAGTYAFLVGCAWLESGTFRI